MNDSPKPSEKYDYVGDEMPSNRIEDLFKPCWIVKAQQPDRVEPSTEQGWVALVVFEDSREMLEMIGNWGRKSSRKTSPSSQSDFGNAF